MELFFFAVLLAAFLAYVAGTKWSTLRAHLAWVWVLMGLHLAGVILYGVIFR